MTSKQEIAQLKQCSTCSWWTRRIVSSWGICEKADGYDSKLFVLQDGIHLGTEPDFGCVEWEEKLDACIPNRTD